MNRYPIDLATEQNSARDVRRPRWRRAIAIVVSLFGLTIAAGTIGPLSPSMIERLLATLGWSGFIVYGFYSLAIFGVVGAAWLVVMGGPRSALAAFTWARLLREAASDLLPFSQIGGIVIGADSLIVRGFRGPAVYAAIAADVTTEMASQALFTMLGIGLFVTTSPVSPDDFFWSAMIGSLAVVGLLAIVARAAPRWIPVIAPLILDRVLPDATSVVRDTAERLGRLYRRRDRMLLATWFNFVAWTLSACGAWIVLYGSGSDVPITRVLSLEAFIFALRSVAFMIPGGIGVQEAGYAIAAPWFGLPMESVVVLAFAKRCKDLAIGLPTLIAWQIGETHRLLRRAEASSDTT